MSFDGFMINESLSIGRSVRQLRQWLRSQKIPTKRVVAGYFVFPMMNVFGMSHATIGIHHIFSRIRLIELFYSMDYLEEIPATAEQSFVIIDAFLRERFGNPSQEYGSFANEDKHCIWSGNGITVSHYLFERFGVEEHFEIRL